MTLAGGPKLTRLVALATGACFLALALGRADLVAVAAPLVVAVAVGVAGTRPPAVVATLLPGADRCHEDDVIDVALEVSTPTGVDELEVGLVVPPGFRALDPARWALTLAPGERHVLGLRLQARRFGAHHVGRIAVRAHGPGRLLGAEEVLERGRVVRVFPRIERLAAALMPLDTHRLTGNHRSRGVGEGVEFASVRPFVAGDAIRQVNWRVTSRRGVLHVNERHRERNADVVLFLDTFAEVGPPGRSTLDRAVRGAATVARSELAQRDRVGLVGFGGTVSWLTAGMGQRQLLRVLHALLDLGIALSYAWKDLAVLPRQALPPLATLVAFSPLVDERALAALLDLRARGYALTVVDTLDPEAVPPGPGDRGAAAHALWRLQREGVRDGLRAAGIPVAPWAAGEDLAVALARLPAGGGRRLRPLGAGSAW